MTSDLRGFEHLHDGAALPSETPAIPAPGRRPVTLLLQRRAAGPPIAAGAADAVDRAAGSHGAPLPAGLRGRFEASLATDLSAVRVHTGAASAAAARALGARAYTTGNDIHFAAGQYGASDPFAVHLLAHEVAHTVQQSRGATGTQHKLAVSEPGDASEREADHAADAMVAGAPAAVTAAAPGAGAARQVIQRDPEPTASPNTSSAVAPSHDLPTAQVVLGPESSLAALVTVPGAGAIVERLRPDLDAVLPLLRQWNALDGQVAALAHTAGIDPADASNLGLRTDVAMWRAQLANNIAALPPAAANVQTQTQSAQVQYRARFTIARTRLQSLQRNRIALHDAGDAMRQGIYQVQAAQGAVDAQEDAERPRPHALSVSGADFLNLLRGLVGVLLQSFTSVAVMGGELLSSIGDHASDAAAEGAGDGVWGAALGRADDQANTYSRDVQRLMAARGDAQAALAERIATFRTTVLACQNEWTAYRVACIDLHAARQELTIQTEALGAAGRRPGGAAPGAHDMTAALHMYNRMQDREQLALGLDQSLADHAWTRAGSLGNLIHTMDQMQRYDVSDGSAWGRIPHSPHDILLKFIDYPSWDALMPAVHDQLQQLLAWSQHRPAARAQFAQWQALLGAITAAPSGTAAAPMADTAAPPPTS